MANTLLAVLLAVPGWTLHVSQQKLSPYDSVKQEDVEGPDMIPLFPKGKVPSLLPRADEAKAAKEKQLKIDKEQCHVDENFPGNVYLADEPAMKPYLINGTSGPTVVIFPGGGYGFLAWGREGSTVAEWLNSIGINAFIVKYRVPSDGKHDLIDAQRAMSLVRHRSKEFGLDPERIGAVGFSAGGGLVWDLAVRVPREYEPVDSVDNATFRPAFVLHIYGAPGWPEMTTLREGKNIPPFFSSSAADDPCIPPATPTGLCDGLNKVGGSCERHVYPNGGHGYGTCAIYTNKWSGDAACQWTKDATVWMQKHGFLTTKA